AGILLTLTLVGDTIVSLFLTTRADRIGRRRALLIGAALMVAAGMVFASTHQLWLLVLAGTIGVISPSGNAVGPLLPVEQAALAQGSGGRTRTEVLAWYTLVGAFATALGALAAGLIASGSTTTAAAARYRVVVLFYAAMGATLAVLFAGLSARAEA